MSFDPNDEDFDFEPEEIEEINEDDLIFEDDEEDEDDDY